MKIEVLKVCFVFFLAFGAALSLQAQPQREGLAPRDLQDAIHPELNLNDDKALLYEPETKPKTTHDSSSFHNNRASLVSPTPMKSRSDAKHADKDEEDALSFNFLYYVIEKFKITDLIDE